MEMYKYIHVFWACDVHGKFHPSIVKMILDPENGFDVSEHLFITSDEKLYEEYSERCNIEYASKIDFRVLNGCASRGRWIIIHGFSKIYQALPISRKIQDRIIWRTWGHDIHYFRYPGQPIKNAVKFLIEQLWRREVKRFRAVGIANIVDRIAVTREFGDVPMYLLGYMRLQKQNVDPYVSQAPLSRPEDGCVRILVGHSGSRNNHHIEILKRLSGLPSEKLKVYLILSYGPEDYVESVKEYVRNNRLDNVSIIDRFMPISEYIQFLAGIDAAVLDGTGSYALGNIVRLIQLQKLIVLNRDGIIREAFDEERVPYRCSDELGTMTLEQLKEKPDYSNMGDGFKIVSYEQKVARWKQLYADLDAEERQPKQRAL